MNKKIDLSSPWVTYYKEIEAMFGEDPNIKVAFDEDAYKIMLFVTGQEKADAIAQLLPTEKKFGNITVYVDIIPANRVWTKADLYRTAFDGNPAFSYTVTVEGVLSNPIIYIVFKNKVVQFYNDDLHDVNGNKTTLYQDIAKEILGEKDGVCFCTDLPDNYGKPVEK